MARTITRDEVPSVSADTEALVEWLRAERQVAERARQPFLRMFHLCLRFWAGDQYADLADSTGVHWEQRRPQPLSSSSIRKIDNQLIVLCRFALSGLSQNMPTMRVQPATTDEEDKARAAFGSRILTHAHRVTKERGKREHELGWLVGAAEVLRRMSWDSKGGDPANPQGELSTQVVNPFRYLKDKYSIEEWPPRYLIEEDARHIDWIKERYGKTVEPERVADSMRFLDNLATAVMSDVPHGQREQMKDSAIVSRLTVPATAKHPRGRTWVFCGEHLLDEHELQAGVFPYSLASWYPIAGRLYPISLVETVLSGQMELNHLVSLLYEAAVRGVRGDIITRGMNTDIVSEVYDERTGARKIDLGPGVDQFEVRTLAADWTQAEARRSIIERGLKEKAGTSEPSLGQPIEKQATAYEIQVVREANQQGIQWHLGRYANDHLTQICMNELELLRRYVVVPRWAQTGGEGMPPEAELFVGSDLMGCDDVIAVPMPYMSPAMRQQAKFQASQAAMGGDWETLEQQWKYRRMLLDMGLDDMESEIARVYGPIEQLEQEMRGMMQLKKQAEAARLEAQIAMGAAATKQAEEAAEGAPAEGENVPVPA